MERTIGGVMETNTSLYQRLLGRTEKAKPSHGCEVGQRAAEPKKRFWLVYGSDGNMPAKIQGSSRLIR